MNGLDLMKGRRLGPMYKQTSQSYFRNVNNAWNLIPWAWVSI